MKRRLKTTSRTGSELEWSSVHNDGVEEMGVSIYLTAIGLGSYSFPCLKGGGLFGWRSSLAR